ncbi:MAG TPA: FecR domain-containing protein [Candidatus Polarisedimenticolia bacterium]|nr:FecR domain-containing protein [Candidatus Polarisedimenticolia bacterium]
MAHGGQRPQVLLDWATISYRSIMRGVVYLVLIAAAGGLFYYLKAARRETPQEQALHEIGQAERMYREAQVAAGADARLGRVAESAAKLLTSARLSYDRQDFPEARSAAQQSQSFAQKILEGSGGEAFTAKIYKYEGDVKIKRARQFVWDTISSNTALRIGDQIKTASNGSAQIIYFDGTITTIKPGSLLEIRELFEDPATRVRKVREKLNWGGVSASMPDANVAGSFHEVSTDSTTARAVSKAQFEIAFDERTHQTRTEVQSGSAEIETGGKKLTLQPQERLEVNREQVVSRQKLLPSPQPQAPADAQVFLLEDPASRTTLLRWAAVEGARRYRLQIARTALFGELLLDKSDIRSTSVQIPGLQEGNYYWRLSAIDAREVESAFSEIRKFKMAGAQDRRTRDATPPPLEVEDFLPTGHLVIINGRTEPGAVLLVDGQKIDVYEDGAFTAVVRMKKEGLNQLEIVAQDDAGNVNRVRRSVYVESF